METTATLGRAELLRVAETVAQEKGIPAHDVIEAMEQAIQTAARRKYGAETEVVAHIDRKTGAIDLSRQMLVVEEIEEPSTQITQDRAQRINKDAEIGDIILEKLPPIDLGRINAQSAKQVIVQKVRDSEREKQYNEFKDRIGEVLVGEVKRVEPNYLLLDLGRSEAIIRRSELIPREQFRLKDRIRCYLYDVREETRGPQVLLSRTHPDFMVKLFAQEVPEIYDGVIELRACARDPGSRAKIAVFSKDPSIDPVGACVGMRGSRVQAVVSELVGEKIDIIPWSADPATFVCNALAPAEVARVVLDPEANRIEVVVPDMQQQRAIGRGGQNVKLASQLTGWTIDIVSESSDSERRNREFSEATRVLVDALNVDEMVAQLLVTEGFMSVEDLAFAPEEDLALIQGLDDDVAAELIERATNWLTDQEDMARAECIELGVTEDLLEFEPLPLDIVLTLAKQGVKSLDDLADLASDELIDMIGAGNVTEEEASEVIMAARAHWFDDEDMAAEEAEDTEAPMDADEDEAREDAVS